MLKPDWTYVQNLETVKLGFKFLLHGDLGGCIFVYSWCCQFYWSSLKNDVRESWWSISRISLIRTNYLILWVFYRNISKLNLSWSIKLANLGVVFFKIVWGFLMCFSLMVHRGPFDIRLDNWLSLWLQTKLK